MANQSARRPSGLSESSSLISASAQQQQKTGSRPSGEKSPLIQSSTTIGAAAESLVNASVVASGGDMHTGVSWGMAAFLLVNTALGAGMLNYPYAYNQIGGVWAAAMMQIILLVFITSTMFILVYCADLNRDDTYHDVLLSMCGKRAQQISALSIMLTCYGINITFLVIIGDQFDRIFNSLMTPEELETFWFMDRKFTIFITSCLFIWPMCYARRLDFLRHASVLGMFAMLYVAFLTVYEHYKLDENMIELVTNSLQAASLPQHGLGTTTTTTTTTTSLPDASSFNQTNVGIPQALTTSTILPKHIQWFEPLAIVPVLCFAYQTHEVIVPVYACMKERFIGNFMKATIFGLVILFFLYNLVGTFGYLTFGERVGADIMSLYDAKDPVVVVGIVALVVKFITTYPPLMFCGRSALDGLYGEIRKMSTSEFKSSEPRRRYVITTLWFASSVAIAVFAPDISVTLQLLGSMASINVFVFPGMCLWSLTRRLRRARMSLLMGELPEGCTTGAPQQEWKDYHLISGSVFGAAMKKNQQAAAAAAANNHCCNPNCASAAGGDTNPKQFTATFASLIEFENNLGRERQNSPSAAANGLARKNSLLLVHNGAGGGSNGLLSASYSTPTTSCSSTSETAKLMNGYGTTTTVAAAAAQQVLLHQNVMRRQDNFERLMTSDSFCCGPDCCSCSCPPASQLITTSVGGTGAGASGGGGSGGGGGNSSSHALTKRHGHHQAHLGRSINDSHDDYSEYNDQEHDHHHSHHQYSHFHVHQQQQQQQQQCHHHRHYNQGPSPRMTIDESHQQIATDQPLDRSCRGGGDKTWSTSARHQYYQRSQCLQTNSMNNYCQQSTTGSLLDKFGASIAPSTVAQIGISRCTASGLYSYAALLIIFGLFIFVLELATVSGLL